MKKSLALMLALIMVLCMIPTTALAVKPGKQSVTIKLAYSDWGYEKTGSKGFTYTFSSPLQGGTGWIYTLGPVEQYVTSQEMSGYNFTGYIVMEKGKRVSKMPGDTWDLGQGNGGMLHVQLQKNNDTPTSSTLQFNTVITGDQELNITGTPFSVTVGNGYTPDDYKTGLDTSNYTYTFVNAERNSGKGLFKFTASSSSGTTSTDSKLRQFFPASGENVVTVYYTAKSKAAPTPTPPANDDIKGLVGSDNIQVKCITANTTHPTERYGLLDGSYTTGTVTKNGDAYTCTITVDPAKYVAKYNETNGDHTLNPNEQSRNITFEWKNNSWALAAGQNLPIIFTVIHNTQEPPTDKPEPPTPPNTSKPFIELTGEEAVKVHCTNDKANHYDKSYGLMHDGYTVGDVKADATNGYTCDITVNPDKYVDQYNLDIGVNHTLVDSDQTGTIHLKYDKEAQKWQLANPSGVPVVFNVKCDNTQPPLDTITIEVSKVWDDDSNKPDQITVLLLANGKEVDRDTIRPDNEDTWFHRFNDMPKNDSNGNLINYTVKEENVPAGWTPYYWTADKLIFRIHNVPTENTREIKVTKTVSGDGADKAKYFDFKVTLLQDLDGNGEIGDGTHPLSDTYTFGGVTFTNGEATFKLKHGESFTITGIPSHVQYLPLQYKVEEIAPSGYTVKVNGSADSSISGAFTDAKTVEINFENIKESGTNPTPSPSTDPSPTPTPTPGGGNGGGHYYPTTTPVPVIVIPPKTGDMTIWQSILHFLGIR